MNESIVNFNSGEVTEMTDVRSDTEKHSGACRILDNMLPEIYGDVTRRPGTKLVLALLPYGGKRYGYGLYGIGFSGE